MFMLSRRSLKYFGMLAFLVAAAGVTPAQIPVEKLLADYKKNTQTTPNDEQRIREMLEGKYLLTKPTAADKAVLKAKAESLVFKITLPEYHGPSNEGSELKAPANGKDMAHLITDMRGWMHVPEKLPKPNVSQLDYIREFGAALDTAILSVLTDKSPPPMLRIAALRMLVAASESGAPAHWSTVHKMLTDPKTPPETLIYAIRAAEMLLASYDPTRTPWMGKNAFEDEKTVVEIVNALEAIVLKGPPIMDRVYIAGDGESTLTTDPKKPPEPGKLTPEQIGVTQAYRYLALRALSRLNLEIIGGKGVEARPLFTLAKVAISDPSIQPPPSTKEIGEALIGMANIIPAKQINSDEELYAMAWAFRMFATPKSNNPDDNSVAWKGCSARMQNAFKMWNEGVQRSSIPPANVKKAAAEFVKLADEAVLNPILKPGLNKPNALAVDGWLKSNPPANGQELYSDKKGLKLVYPGGK
jgi:hypothetical protein